MACSCEIVLNPAFMFLASRLHRIDLRFLHPLQKAFPVPQAQSVSFTNCSEAASCEFPFIVEGSHGLQKLSWSGQTNHVKQLKALERRHLEQLRELSLKLERRQRESDVELHDIQRSIESFASLQNLKNLSISIHSSTKQGLLETVSSLAWLENLSVDFDLLQHSSAPYPLLSTGLHMKQLTSLSLCNRRYSRKDPLQIEISLQSFPTLQALNASNIHVAGLLTSSSLKSFFSYEWKAHSLPISTTFGEVPGLTNLSLEYPFIDCKVYNINGINSTDGMYEAEHASLHLQQEHIIMTNHRDVERLELARLGSLRTLSLCRNSYKGKSTRDIKDPVSGLGVLEKILLDVAGLQKLSMLTISDQDQDITLASMPRTSFPRLQKIWLTCNKLSLKKSWVSGARLQQMTLRCNSLCLDPKWTPQETVFFDLIFGPIKASELECNEAMQAMKSWPGIKLDFQADKVKGTEFQHVRALRTRLDFK